MRYDTPENIKKPRVEIESLKPGRLNMKTKVIVKRYMNDEDKRNNKPYNISVHEGNTGQNVGIANLLDFACSLGGSPAAYDSTGSYVFVGDVTTVATATQGALLAATSATASAMHGMDATTNPSRSDQTVSFVGTYGATDANFHWAEFSVEIPSATVDASSGVKTLVRAVSDQGTKVSGQSWELTLAITQS